MNPLPLRTRLALVLFSFFLLAPLAHATTWNVAVGTGGGRTFTPATVTIAPGDTVQWTWAGNFHSATSGTPGSPSGLFDSGVNNSGFVYSFTFPSLGSVPYYCTVHGSMMTGTVNVVAATQTPSPAPTASPSPTPAPSPTPTPAATATPSPTPIVAAAVVQVGPGSDPFGFVPVTVSIQPGETVEWDWLSDFHTVTSGTIETPDGLFDSDVQNTGFVFYYTFTTPGSYPYVCLIHGSMMSGTINVGVATPTPTPAALAIFGGVGNCASPAPTATPPAAPTPATLPPTSGVTMTLTGTSSATTTTNGSGNYLFNFLTPGGSFAVTPSKAALTPGSAGINTTDVIAIQRHFLNLSVIPTGCRLTAADANTNGSVNTQDVLAVQRFFLGFSSGTGSAGQYRFAPASRSYSPLNSTQTGQNYEVLVLGDISVPFNN